MPLGSSNKRVAKNTIVLYARMFFILAINLYTARVILHVLGIEDYGIYNVIAGFVMMFGFLNTAMATSSSRYIAYEQGTGDLERQKKVYSTTVIIHLSLAILIVLIAELLGIWYINDKMVYPVERKSAANFVFQAAVVSFFFNIISVPYTSSIIAHENMGIYAVVSIVDAILKLVIVFLLPISPIDKLVFYSILLLLVSVINFSIYSFYCHKKYSECHFKSINDLPLFKEMLGFAGWSFVGNFGISAKDYGVNLVLNLFFGPSVNAARAVAFQVSSAINGFVSNFQLALNPQITKRYAAREMTSMTQLMKRGAKYSFFLLAIIIIPVIVRADYILSIWLVEVPNQTSFFLQLVLLMALINSMYGPVSTAVLATGEIKTYQIVVATIMFLDVPLSYLFLRLGFQAYVVFIIGIISAMVALIARLVLLNRKIEFGLHSFLLGVVLKNLMVFALMIGPILAINVFFTKDFLGLVLITLISVLWSTLMVLFVGLGREERMSLINTFSSFIKRGNAI